MQIVIDIPNKAYENIVKNKYDYGDMNVIIQNGTPLPEGHGRLIDEEQEPCEDAVSRQAVLNTLDKRFDSIPVGQTMEILLLRKDLRELPPVTSYKVESEE